MAGLAGRPDDGSLSARLGTLAPLVVSRGESVEVAEVEQALADECGEVAVEPVVVAELL